MKKIKNLTNQEIDNICKRYIKEDGEGKVHCFECPLGNPTYCICINSDKEWFLERYGNKEIEVNINEEKD